MTGVQNVEDAVAIAERFLKKYYTFLRLEKVQRSEDIWIVEFDVGILKTEIVHIKLDAQSEKVTEYTKL